MNIDAQYGNLFASEMTAGASARIVKTPHRDAGGKGAKPGRPNRDSRSSWSVTATPSPMSTRRAGAAPANALTGLIASRFEAMPLMRAVTGSRVRGRFLFFTKEPR